MRTKNKLRKRKIVRFPFKNKLMNTMVGIFAVLAITILSTVSYYGFNWSILASLSFYENLANPSVRIVRIQEGLRKEEIAEIMAEKLNWSEKEKSQFINAHFALNNRNFEGRYFPKTYLLSRNESPIGVTSAMLEQFTKETDKIKKNESALDINQDTAVKIASIIQREAAGKHDMRLISGIIWNRLFKGMKLQIDATLQYAKGNEDDGWWRRVNSVDKYIDSSYNTYLHPGLPPSPIANPGLAAIEAAYNPQKTKCLFYLHDKKGRIHCSETYEGHKRNIEVYY